MSDFYKKKYGQLKCYNLTMWRANIFLKAAPTVTFKEQKININTSDLLVMSICMSKTHTYIY